MARHDRLCVTVLLALSVLVACGSKPDVAGEPTTIPAAAAPSSSATSTTSPPPPVPAGQETRCTAAVLAGIVQPTNAAAGHRAGTLVVRNNGPQPCTLLGFGGLELLDPTRKPIPTNAERTLDPVPTLVRLRPGGAAGKLLRWKIVAAGNAAPTAPCHPEAGAIAVTPPDETEPFVVDFGFGSVCDGGRIETSAYFPR